MNIPPRGSIVVLRSQAGESHRGRVVGTSPGHVAFELEDDQDRTFGLRERVLVTWPEEGGIICLPTTVIDVPVWEDRGWLAEIAGEPWNEQRRKYARAVIEGTVSLRRRHSTSFDIAIGDLVDLSEAGLRCTISTRFADLAEPETEVTLTLVVDEDEFELNGKVLYGRQSARSDGRLEFVVLFDRPVLQSERLRLITARAERQALAAARNRLLSR
ncbi:hypothetical protein M6D93_06330 [Jatrophihabitans telluris]|uniref:PilZ domain-containing protein n=1 Tax=Jatrophihabitans telluris TaxID=2038343 RepID=A0ABY4R1M0_9ACTN|nr:hypothetical protein [Jatrophihabitans telluris]UQX89620.1 hypothetical protein M6D93_06330 [Jatrophihabitans telluris]